MKNVFRGLQLFCKDPLAGIPYVLGQRSMAQDLALRRLLRLVSIEPLEWQQFLEQFRSNLVLRSHLKSRLGSRNFGQITDKQAEVLYGLCRVLKPRLVIETGVAAGVSSAIILQALADNGTGKLWSIDLPNYDALYLPRNGKARPSSVLPAGESSGWAIPDILRSRWTIELGFSKELLPNLLRKGGRLDIFFHDSEHTYTNMMWEFTQAWNHLRVGGLIVSHDVHWNDSFHDFCKSVNEEHVLMHQSCFLDLGIVRKSK